MKGYSTGRKSAILKGMPGNTPCHRSWNPLLLLLLVVGIWLTADVPLAHAQATSTAGSIQDGITWAMAMALQLMQILTWVLFGFLNYLLDPRFFLNLGNDGAGNAVSGLLDMLNDIWVLSRDLMNVIFAVALVFTALYTVITAKKDFVSQNAKRFVMAVVLVNFSWFVPQVLLDISSVATATIYSIPSLLDMGDCQTADGKPCIVITDVQFPFGNAAQAATLQGSDGWTCHLGNFVCYRKKDLNSQTTSSQTGILSGLVINHARLIELAKVSRPIETTGTRASRELLVFFIRESIIFIITIALFFPLLAMVVAFFVRIPVLWITMAFMPFALLDWVIPNERITQGIPGKIRDQFIKAAFLPAFVAVPLTVGFILINAGAKMQGGGLERIPFPLLSGIDNFWQLLWLLISLAVLYTGVFSVLKKQDGILATGAASIEGFGKSLGKLAVSIPLSKEVIALPTASGQSTSILQAANQFNPNRLLQDLRRTGSIRDALNGPTQTPERQYDATAGILRSDRDALNRLNASISRLNNVAAGDNAAFRTETSAVIAELRRINPSLNVNDNRSLATALQQLNRRNDQVNAPSNTIDRLNRPEPATPAPATPPPATPAP